MGWNSRRVDVPTHEYSVVSILSQAAIVCPLRSSRQSVVLETPTVATVNTTQRLWRLWQVYNVCRWQESSPRWRHSVRKLNRCAVEIEKRKAKIKSEFGLNKSDGSTELFRSQEGSDGVFTAGGGCVTLCNRRLVGYKYIWNISLSLLHSGINIQLILVISWDSLIYII